jgi:hypothetical protein
MTLRCAVGIKSGNRADQMTIEAEDALERNARRAELGNREHVDQEGDDKNCHNGKAALDEGLPFLQLCHAAVRDYRLFVDRVELPIPFCETIEDEC